MSKGKLIVIEGLDGSGKATQAKRLAAALAAEGRLVREITFPDYASDSSALIKMYLAGQFGSKPDDVNAYAASSFFARSARIIRPPAFRASGCTSILRSTSPAARRIPTRASSLIS